MDHSTSVITSVRINTKITIEAKVSLKLKSAYAMSDNIDGRNTKDSTRQKSITGFISKVTMTAKFIFFRRI